MNNEDNPATPHVSPFEAIRQEGEDGSEYWSARDLSKILGYTEWRNFNTAIEKAKEACQNSGQAVSDHFVGFNKMIEVGKRNRSGSNKVHSFQCLTNQQTPASQIPSKMKEDSMQSSDLGHISPNTIRLEIAQRIIERKRRELGEHLVAAACYGSVAHNAALPHSDVEIVIVTDDTVTAKEAQFFEQGIMVECDMLPASRMLAAARRVTRDWGIEADQYRHHLVIWDPDQFFPRLWAVATDIPQEDFDNALKASWWDAYEIRGKVYNALLAEDHPRMSCMGWEFAYSAAMHIALHERKPYESGRTLWRDVTTRGYGMKELAGVLTTGALEKITGAVDNVWEQIKAWGAPTEM